eukprot:CAMPEP_0203756214 /NCGR_PEP_ID=MMETSP0098-20131031/9529_1 /ASSEMBLY_ACC=CAM_ASM_000208 /TAXON_ID=96639 /ORGANISM=" , Strain NY0313808BC1" /LENGTH=496 /DNA_ID=CAMNT_0050647999 /DNA_START=18 /DNA_END=1508 /DNA_ORIENTATION=-
MKVKILAIALVLCVACIDAINGLHGRHTGRDLLRRADARRMHRRTYRAAVRLKRALMRRYRHVTRGRSAFFKNAAKVWASREITNTLGAAVLSKTIKCSVSGSSVSAGYDIFHNQSYPYVFQELMKPIMDAMKTTMTMKNQARSNNDMYPESWVLDAVIEDTTDIIFFEHMFDYALNDKEDIDMWVRNAMLTSAKRPVVSFVASDFRLYGSRLNRCSANTRTEYNIITGEKSFPYPNIPVVQFDHNNGVCHGDVKHPFLSHNGLMVKDKPVPNNLNMGWHANKHGHRLMASILAYRYADLFVKVTRSLARGWRPKVVKKINELPDPAICSKSFLPCTARAYARTAMKPHLNPGARGLTTRSETNWEWKERAPHEINGWNVYEELGLGYIDAKAGYYGTRGSGTILFDFEIFHEPYGALAVCSYRNAYPDEIASIRERVSFKIDGEPVTPNNSHPYSHNILYCAYFDNIQTGKHTLQLRVKLNTVPDLVAVNAIVTW